MYIPTVLKENTFQSKLSTLLGLQFHQERLPGVKNTLVMWMPYDEAVFHLDCLPKKTRTWCITISDLSILFSDSSSQGILSACARSQYFHNLVNTIFSSIWRQHFICSQKCIVIFQAVKSASTSRNMYLKRQTTFSFRHNKFLGYFQEMFHWCTANLTKCFIVEWYCHFTQFCGITTASATRKEKVITLG